MGTGGHRIPDHFTYPHKTALFHVEKFSRCYAGHQPLLQSEPSCVFVRITSWIAGDGVVVTTPSFGTLTNNTEYRPNLSVKEDKKGRRIL